MENPDFPRSKVPYLLGILCLIPLVGAFVGLGLLLYALIYYKDKWLAIIGAFGILFTVSIYSFLFYFLFHSNVVNKGFEQISQRQLTPVLKSIEYYKLMHGMYPDSLVQITREDKSVAIYDPCHFGHFGCYQYERVGDKYLLFSAGPDYIPNTKDDIYPTILKDDSSKIGWIRNK